MSRRRKHDAAHDNAERWLLTYADLITLLLGLFVILYASSQVDMKQFARMMAAFNSLFAGAGAGIAEGGPGLFEGVPPIKPPEENSEMSRRLGSAVEEAINQGRISLSETSRGLTVHVTEKLLFDPGQAELRAEAIPVLESLGQTLASLPNEIRVEGHTDDTPIHTAQYPDNWHLSVARALRVGLYLLSRSSIKPERLAVVGYGEFRPIAPNDTDPNKARNRRVDLVIVK